LLIGPHNAWMQPAIAKARCLVSMCGFAAGSPSVLLRSSQRTQP
jgi:hypothetical protein